MACQFVPHPVLEVVLAVFLLVAAGLLLFSHRPTLVRSDRTWPLYLLGSSVGALSGMLEVGGGTLLMPALIVLGHDPKKAA